MITAPGSPAAFDFDASLATDPDLANNGFIVNQYGSPFATVTRAGPVDFFNAPASGTYQSSLLGGLLYIRTAVGDQILISKQLTLPCTIKSHVWNTRQSSGAVAQTIVMGGLANPAGTMQVNTGTSQYFATGSYQGDWQVYSQAAGNAVSVAQQVTTPLTDNVVYLHVPSYASPNQQVNILSGTSVGFRQPVPPVAGLLSLPMQRAGLMLSTKDGCAIFDFIRMLPLNTYP